MPGAHVVDNNAHVQPSRGNIDVYFVLENELAIVEPNFVAPNSGFAWSWWGDDGVIDRARVVIASNNLSQERRDHLIREEFAHTLGILNDSHRHADSVFTLSKGRTTQFAAIDLALLKMLYLPEVAPNMDEGQVKAVLANMPTFSKAERDYFYEIGIGPQYGEKVRRIRKWQLDPTVHVYGTPTDRDLAVLRDTIDTINQTIDKRKIALGL